MAKVAIADTNVVSFFLKDEPLGVEYQRLLEGYDVHIAFVTVAELNYWAEKNAWGPRRRFRLRHILADLPVLPHRQGVSEAFARVRIQRERAGRRMATADAWIAATAISFDVPLATHDGDFLGTPGLRVISVSQEVCLERDRSTAAHRALALNQRCACGV